MSQVLPYSKLHSYLCGLDRLTGEIKGFAFAQAQPAAVDGAAGATQALEFNKVESYEQLATALSIDVKAQARFGLFGADASFSFDKSLSMNSYSIFVYAVASVERAFTQVLDPQYKPEAVALIKSAGGNAAFRKAYGDWFIRGMTTGGQFLSLVEIRTTSESQRQDIDAALSGSYGLNFSADAKVKSSFSQATQHSETHIVQRQVGGITRAISKPEDVFDQMIAWVTELSAPGCTTAVPFQSGCVSYDTVPIPDAPNQIDIDQAEQSLDMLAQLRLRHVRAINDIDYVLTNQGEFVWEGPVAKDAWVKALNDTSAVFTRNLTTVQKAASAIAHDVTTQVDLDNLIAIPSIDMPKRQAGPAPEHPVADPPAGSEPTGTRDWFLDVRVAERTPLFIKALQDK